MTNGSVIENLFLLLPSINDRHAPDTKIYNFLKQVLRKEVEERFTDHELNAKEFKPIGDLVFPYHNMGAIDSLNLFDLDEVILFSFYWVNRKRYRTVIDIGANIGLHSVILSKCGYKVRAYEPDPGHFQLLKRNLELNDCSNNSEIFNMAMSDKRGSAEFIRVLGNTTSSHLSGSKANPYGELERFQVQIEDIGSLERADLIKLDAEGHEKEILLATNHDHWKNTDALVEIGNEQNASIVYDHFRAKGINLFSQKINWRRVTDLSHMPVGYQEGTLFISMKDEMPWSENSD